MPPLNRLVECADRQRQLKLRYTAALAEFLGGSGAEARMPFRVGFPVQDAGLSPRRDVRAILIQEPAFFPKCQWHLIRLTG